MSQAGRGNYNEPHSLEYHPAGCTCQAGHFSQQAQHLPPPLLPLPPTQHHPPSYPPSSYPSAVPLQQYPSATPGNASSFVTVCLTSQHGAPLPPPAPPLPLHYPAPYPTPSDGAYYNSGQAPAPLVPFDHSNSARGHSCGVHGGGPPPPPPSFQRSESDNRQYSSRPDPRGGSGHNRGHSDDRQYPPSPDAASAPSVPFDRSDSGRGHSRRGQRGRSNPNRGQSGRDISDGSDDRQYPSNPAPRSRGDANRGQSGRGISDGSDDRQYPSNPAPRGRGDANRGQSGRGISDGSDDRQYPSNPAPRGRGDANRGQSGRDISDGSDDRQYPSNPARRGRGDANRGQSGRGISRGRNCGHSHPTDRPANQNRVHPRTTPTSPEETPPSYDSIYQNDANQIPSQKQDFTSQESEGLTESNSSRNTTSRGRRRGRGKGRGQMGVTMLDVGGVSVRVYQESTPQTQNLALEVKTLKLNATSAEMGNEDGAVENLKKTKPKRKKKSKNANAENSSEKTPEKTAPTIRVTKAVLQIMASFTDSGSLKDAISQNIDTSDNVTVSFVEESIICCENKGICTLILHTESKQLAKRVIKALGARLRKSLKAAVQCDISSADKESLTQEETPPDCTSVRDSRK